MNIDALAATHAAANPMHGAWSAQSIESLLRNPFVFCQGDARCFAIVQCAGAEAELLTIATHPDMQRQGLARAVMRAWEADAVTRGAQTALLEVAADNAAAKALYLGEGYGQIGLRKGYYARAGEVKVDALLLSKALTIR